MREILFDLISNVFIDVRI